MEEVAEVVNQHAKEAKQPAKSVDEVAMGFIRVANETMCRPIRALTQMRVSHPCLQHLVSSCIQFHGEPSSKAVSDRVAGDRCHAFQKVRQLLACLHERFKCCLQGGSSLSSSRMLRGRRQWTACFVHQGYDVAAHVLACFGGAGGQHACAIAAALGMRTIFVHRYSGILSAVGGHRTLLASCCLSRWFRGLSHSHPSNSAIAGRPGLSVQ